MRCTERRADGTACGGKARPGRVLCWAHDPELAAARKAGAAAGGKGSARIVRLSKGLPQHLSTLRDTLIESIKRVKDGELDPRAGEAIAKLSREVLEIDRFALETSEALALANRIAELEAEVREIAS